MVWLMAVMMYVYVTRAIPVAMWALNDVRVEGSHRDSWPGRRAENSSGVSTFWHQADKVPATSPHRASARQAQQGGFRRIVDLTDVASCPCRGPRGRRLRRDHALVRCISLNSEMDIEDRVEGVQMPGQPLLNSGYARRANQWTQACQVPPLPTSSQDSGPFPLGGASCMCGP